jgi:hypothetical protein
MLPLSLATAVFAYKGFLHAISGSRFKRGSYASCQPNGGIDIQNAPRRQALRTPTHRLHPLDPTPLQVSIGPLAILMEQVFRIIVGLPTTPNSTEEPFSIIITHGSLIFRPVPNIAL